MVVPNEVAWSKKQQILRIVIVIVVATTLCFVGYVVVASMMKEVQPMLDDNSTIVYINFKPNPNSTSPVWEQYRDYEQSKSLYPIIFWGGLLFVLSVGILYIWYISRNSPVETEKVIDVAS
jgi:uncharacterized membrane protein YjfL (UPF0719 family)